MKYKKEIDIINGLIDLAEVTRIHNNQNSEPYKSFDFGEYNITFWGFVKLEKFNKGLETLFNFNKEITETWTLKNFENDLVDLIRQLKNEKRSCTTQDLELFFEKFTKVKIQESEILYEIYGIEMYEPKIYLGEFTFYNFDKSIGELTERFPELADNERYFSHRKSKYLIGISVKARENAKALEIANKICETIDNVFSYMIADFKHQRTVGIFNFRDFRADSIVVCNSNSTIFHGSKNISLPVNICDPFFKDTSQGNDKIWYLITKPQKTEIEKRLLNSIEWMGKAIHDLDLSKSLVQFVIAIEGMLQSNDKAIITPSIVSQLSDWLAFIIDDDLEQRKNIAKYFKAIYQKRSAIAHGAAKTIETKDLKIAHKISKSLIVRFLTSKPFCEMKTIDELNNYITELKFR